jgi:isocitrate/isopropylmalate dehydrogenase
MRKKRYTVACLSGDGIGPEVTAEASRALAVVSGMHGFHDISKRCVILHPSISVASIW